MTLSAHAGLINRRCNGSGREDYSVSLAMDVGNGYSVGIDFIDNSGDGAVAQRSLHGDIFF